jgi:predicted dehydrogenase
VVLEKPMALSPKECEELVRLSQKMSGQVALIDHELRFLETMKKMRQMIANGACGRLFHVEGVISGGGRIAPKV